MPIFQGFERKRVLLKWESSEKKWRGRGLGVLGDWEKKGKEENLERCYPSRSSFWFISIEFWLVLQQNFIFAMRQKIFCQITVPFLIPLYPESERREKDAECHSLPSHALLSGSRIIYCTDAIQKKDSVQSCFDFIWLQFLKSHMLMTE